MAIHDGGVNLRKIMEGDINWYDLSNPAEIFVIEGVANALDEQTANATRVDITLLENGAEKMIQIMDNGYGMRTYNDLIQYHKYGSISKKRTIRDIGFVGVGIKVILPYSKMVYTDTRNLEKESGFIGASRWWFPEYAEDTKWEDLYNISEEFKLKNPSGTCVTAILSRPEDMAEITKERLIQLVQYFYIGVLIGHYGKREIYVNGVKVEAKYNPTSYSQPTGEHRIRTLDKIGMFEGKQYPPKCFFFKTDKPMPEEDQGIFIIVGKKTIQKQKDYFKQRVVPELESYLCGYIVADYLIGAIRNTKDGFHEGKKDYKEFYNDAAVEWTHFLDLINAQRKAEAVDERTQKLVESIEKDLDKLLKKGPLTELDIQLARKKRLLKKDVEPTGEKNVIVPTKNGTLPGLENSDTVITDAGGGSNGEGGTGPGKTGDGIRPTINAKEPGDQHGEKQLRHVGQRRGGCLKIVVMDDKRNLEAWYDNGAHFVAINKSFPTYKFAEEAGTKVMDYHIRRLAVDVLIKEGDSEDKMQLFNDCFQEMI